MITPKNIRFLEINQCDDIVTNIDQPKLREQYAFEMKGFNNQIPGVVADRDRGSKNVCANNAYPSVPETGILVGGPRRRFYDRTNNAEFDIVASYNATSGYTRIFANDSVYASANPGTVNNWIELTRVLNAKVNGTPGATSGVANINTIQDSLNNAYTPGASELQYFRCYNVTRSNMILVLACTADSITSDGAYLGSTGLGWQTGDQLVFFRHFWMFDNKFGSIAATAAAQNLALGATPHLRWLPIETQNKIKLAIGDSGNPPTMNIPMQIHRNAQKKYFWTGGAGGGAAGLTIPANWSTSKGCNLCKYFKQLGSPLASAESATLTTDLVDIEDASGNKFMRLGFSYTDQTDDGQNCFAMRFAVTLVYEGYQESDPIYRAYIASTNSGLPSVSAQMSSLYVNFARMDPRITSLRIYADALLKGVANWVDADTGLVLVREIFFQQNDLEYQYDQGSYTSNGSPNWSIQNTPSYNDYSYLFSYSGTITVMRPGTVVQAKASRVKTLADVLQRASISAGRTTIKPRYFAKTAREDQGLVACDSDDRTLLVSPIDGYGNIEDDNFVPIADDNSGNPLQIKLLGDGQLLGVETMEDTPYALRNNLAEAFDLQAGVYRSYPIDLYTKDGICPTEYGIVVCGKSSIQLLPIRGGQVQIMNPNWLNLYDGRLRTNDNTLQQITDTYRQTMVTGYSAYSKEFFVHLQRNDPYTNTATWWTFIAAFPKSANERFKWRERVFNITGTRIYYFSQTTLAQVTPVVPANSFLLGTSAYILYYPNLTSSLDLSWEDEVQSSEATNSKPITCDLGINLGSLTGIQVEAILYNLLLYLKARAVSTGINDTFTIDFYANEETTSFDTMTIPVNSTFRPRKLKSRGAVQRLRMRIQLTSTNTDTKEFTISKASLGMIDISRPGNR